MFIQMHFNLQNLQGKSAMTDWKLTFYTLNEAESTVAAAEHFLWKPGLQPGARSQWFLGHHFPDWIYENWAAAIILYIGHQDTKGKSAGTPDERCQGSSAPLAP